MTTLTRPAAGEFKGRVGGVEYDDWTLFEKAARALGYKRGRENRWKLGAPVRVDLNDGTEVHGQVWSPANINNYVWVALDDGTFVAVYTPVGHVSRSPSGEWIGRAA